MYFLVQGNEDNHDRSRHHNDGGAGHHNHHFDYRRPAASSGAVGTAGLGVRIPVVSDLPNRPIIVFDGVCNLCNAGVDFVMRLDRAGLFLFTANEHDTGRRILDHFGRPVDEVGTMYLLHQGVLHSRSTAVLRIAYLLGFPWKLAYVAMMIPRFARDRLYRVIADNRYRWFGRRDSCRLPAPEERSRFLL